MKAFLEKIKEIKQMFPNVEMVWFKKPLEISKYIDYNCADMVVGLNLKNNQIIYTDGDWMSSQYSYKFNKINRNDLKNYYKKLSSMSMEDFTSENIWTREYSENYYMKVINSGKGYNEIIFRCGFVSANC